MRGDVQASAPAHKGKLVARRGRKATGLEYESAGLPSGHKEPDWHLLSGALAEKEGNPKEGSK
jgi:hypothetical protein